MRRGYAQLYFDHVQQADQGADLDFLVGSSGSAILNDAPPLRAPLPRGQGPTA